MALNRKWWWGVATFLVLVITAYSFWLDYKRAHLMIQVNWATVEMDGHPTPAEAYIGQPTDNEAEAFLLVHIAQQGDFMLNFDNENYRIATSGEYIRLRRGVWMRKPIVDGQFVDPLKPMRINEYRISSNGHLFRVQF